MYLAWKLPIEETIRIAISCGHPSHTKVQPFPGQRQFIPNSFLGYFKTLSGCGNQNHDLPLCSQALELLTELILYLILYV